VLGLLGSRLGLGTGLISACRRLLRPLTCVTYVLLRSYVEQLFPQLLHSESVFFLFIVFFCFVIRRENCFSVSFWLASDTHGTVINFIICCGIFTGTFQAGQNRGCSCLEYYDIVVASNKPAMLLNQSSVICCWQTNDMSTAISRYSRCGYTLSTNGSRVLIVVICYSLFLFIIYLQMTKGD